VKEIRILVRLALLAALVTAATLVLRIPMPATEGYINVGDAVIVAGALLLGGRAGGLGGGVGSALADLYGGYSHWAPFTLVIKGIEGWAIGSLAEILKVDMRCLQGLVLGGVLAAGGLAWMVGGYFLVEWYLYSLGPALASLPGNALQAAASLVVGLPLATALQRSQGLGKST
jgi:uncharacterized membrane protein